MGALWPARYSRRGRAWRVRTGANTIAQASCHERGRTIWQFILALELSRCEPPNAADAAANATHAAPLDAPRDQGALTNLELSGVTRELRVRDDDGADEACRRGQERDAVGAHLGVALV